MLFRSLAIYNTKPDADLTLHARWTKILPGEKDSVVVIFCMPSVRFLLQVGPATHILQALRRVPNLYQAHGLDKPRRKDSNSYLLSLGDFFSNLFQHLTKYSISIKSLFLINNYASQTNCTGSRE